jgi:hypothetical protein
MYLYSFTINDAFLLVSILFLQPWASLFRVRVRTVDYDTRP